MFKRLLLIGLVLAFGVAHAAEGGTWEKLFDVNQRFANAGSKEGQFKLAEMYEEGRGTPMDLAKAREWYEKAARQGHEEAQHRIQNWDARQAELAQKRRDEEQARMEAIAAEKRAEAERHARLEAQKKAEEDRARQAEQKRIEEERKRLANLKHAEQEKVRQAAQKRVTESAAARPDIPSSAEKISPVPVAAVQPKVQPPAAVPAESTKSESFETDPCKTATAKFLSTCRNK